MSEEENKKADPLLGKIVGGRYEILKLLGKGGMGKVFKVRHVELEKVFAMKTLHTHLTHDLGTVERFKREAKAASKIGCEHIIEMTDVGEDPEAGHFFIMEFLQGDDLSKRIKNNGPMHYTEACHIILQICDALAAVHAEGIIHRDLKPENLVLIDKDRRMDVVKILDFGIAAMKSQYEEGAERLTQAGTIFGTPTYMSPEQAYGMDLDHRTDLYSLGCIIYEMLTGFVPFKADHPLQVLDMHLNVPPTPPSQVRPDLAIPPPMEAVVLRCMAKVKEERYQTANEIAQAILTFYQPGVTPITSTRGNISSGPQMAGQLAQPRIGSTGAMPQMGMTGAYQQTGPSGPSKRTLVLIASLVVIVGLVTGGLFMLKKNTEPQVKAQSKEQIEKTLAQREKDKAEAGRIAKLEALTEKLSEQPAPSTVVAAAPEKPKDVTLTFDSDPAGATVVLNGETVGITRFSKSFPISDAKAKFTFKLEGYEQQDLDVALSESTTSKIVLKKKAAPPPVASSGSGKPRTPRTPKPGGGGGGATKPPPSAMAPAGITGDFQ